MSFFLNQSKLFLKVCGTDYTALYILKDVKIRDVLGHFQKDFEGGVSAENLGKSTCQIRRHV